MLIAQKDSLYNKDLYNILIVLPTIPTSVDLHCFVQMSFLILNIFKLF